MADVIKRGDNPYVGPQAFKYGEKLYGRDREVLSLLDLLIAERIVMLYSPSGAGKSSLVQAGLMPKLEGEGFWVLPVMRVSLEPPAGIAAETSNRYVLSAILWLEEGRDEAERLSDADLASLTLAEYLDRREEALEELEGTVLIFDQFEEILTVDPTDRAAKQAFFRQVGEALRAPHRWALFSLREDYIAGLDPYLRLIPTRLHTTFRLELLGEAAAREAIQKPARDAGVDFTDPAAQKLVDNLLGKMLVQQADGSTHEERGLFVEPVQLQVVCLDLWDRLPAQTTRIEPSHIDQVGDVDTALANYYAAAVERIARDYDVPERVIRRWCGQELITQGGIRSQILRQEAATHGMAAPVINALVDVYLVRAEKRRGLTWYELAHDRLIKPVQTDNDRWEAGHLSTLQRQAALWVDQGRPEGLLLRAEALVDAERWAQDHADELQDSERDFLARSQEVRKAEERERRLSRLIRLTALGLAVVFLVALGAAIFACVKATEANQQRAIAVAALKTVAAVQTAVKAADQLALEKGQTAVAAQEAVATAQFVGTPDVRQQQTAEAALIAATEAIAQADAARTQVEQALVQGLAAVAPTDTPFATPTVTSTPLPTDTATPTPEPTPQTVSDGGLIQITQDRADEYVPSYSPDQRRLVIMSNRTGEWQVFIVDPEGGEWRQLTGDGSNNYHPRIAPDGQTVIYSSDASRDQELYAMKLDGTGLRQLTDSPGPDTYPSYTRDGRHVVFMSQRSGTWGIYAMNADGSDQRVVYDTEEANEAYPHVSPDGQYVVFQSDQTGNWEIYMIPIDGTSQPRRLTDNPARDAQPVFSPDGRSIAFETNRDGDYEIYIMDADGGNQRNLTQFESGNDQVPFFASDGSLVFQSDRNGSWDIYQIPLQAEPTIAAQRTPIATPTPPVRLLEDFGSLQNFTLHQNGGVPSNEKNVTLASPGLTLEFEILNYDEPYVGLEWRQEQEDWSSFSEICVCIKAELSPGLGIGIQVGESDNYKAHQSLIVPDQDRSPTSQCLTNSDLPAYCAAFDGNWTEKQRLGDLKAAGYYGIFVDAWSVDTHRGEGTLYLGSIYLR